ncbi:zinc-dependent alcohol dehydrogenase [Paenibacillus riograndensis]|uniref:Alcohol dehydrogenase zinc-binding domain protein n=1 Tax=Paenibacillus riograndensis SBR5 TaxID=1073571 RepID=A0A0E4CXQ0_9BACL|nr:zinc-binding alcohol dehydrogenase [Paenibacillus riograndensis]CQR56630.1 Alcohol dehydrogenase zinc-binding domain protein [Paenibacillus riograndensis SBR5]
MRIVAAKEGKVAILQAAIPELNKRHVQVRTEYSGISPGTELSSIKRSGLSPVSLGYSAVGIVEQTGSEVRDIHPGDRVACYGVPYVRHAEVISVPTNLVTKVPHHVNPEEAAFTGLGAIAIHALRTADVRFGDKVLVVGLGILGNLVAQIASAAACHTAAYDLSEDRVQLLQGQMGITSGFSSEEEVEHFVMNETGGAGFDSILLCAGGPGEVLINKSLEWLRDLGKIVIVGDLSMEFSRDLMFRKEAQILISRAGGPGRYDMRYEEDNQDYPIGFVRWTEGRNMDEYVRLLAEKRITVSPAITHRFALEEAPAAYGIYQSGPAQGALATLIKYV